jgi:hypothetical protein
MDALTLTIVIAGMSYLMFEVARWNWRRFTVLTRVHAVCAAENVAWSGRSLQHQHQYQALTAPEELILDTDSQRVANAKQALVEQSRQFGATVLRMVCAMALTAVGVMVAQLLKAAL